MPEFASLLAAARDGDEAAFVRLFRSAQPALLRYLTTIGGPVAEDAAAETWACVVRDLHRFEGDENGFRAWVFTIGHARLRDTQRKEYRTPMPVDAHAELADRPAPDDVPEAVGELVTTEAALRLVASLPRDQAEAVLLRHVAGLDVPTTAMVLGKRPGAVRVAVHRGLKRLAAVLDERRTTDRGVTR